MNRSYTSEDTPKNHRLPTAFCRNVSELPSFFLFYFVCVLTHVRVPLHAQVQECGCAYICGCQWTTLGCYFGDRISTDQENSLIRLGWLVSKPQRAPCFCLPSSGIASTHHIWPFTRSLRDTLGSSCLDDKHLADRDTTPAPELHSYKENPSPASMQFNGITLCCEYTQDVALHHPGFSSPSL